MSKPRRLGLFGGTFNPIHTGHLQVAEAAQRLMALDEVLFVPTGHPPHKPAEDLAPPHHRLAMTRLGIADHPGFRITEIEVGRDAPSYSIETVRALKAQGQARGPEEVFFIMGLDAFLEIPAWREVKALLALCHFVIAARPGYRFAEVTKVLTTGNLAVDPDRLDQIDAFNRAGLDRDRLDLPLTPTSMLTLLRITPSTVSASAIRASLRAGLLPDPAALSPAVKSYILTHRLYTGAG